MKIYHEKFFHKNFSAYDIYSSVYMYMYMQIAHIHVQLDPLVYIHVHTCTCITLAPICSLHICCSLYTFALFLLTICSIHCCSEQPCYMYLIVTIAHPLMFNSLLYSAKTYAGYYCISFFEHNSLVEWYSVSINS